MGSKNTIALIEKKSNKESTNGVRLKIQCSQMHAFPYVSGIEAGS